MSINFINTGTSPNKGDGDSLRTAFIKINQNFSYINTALSTLNTGSEITVIDQTIYGTVPNKDIEILPNGTGTVVIPSIETSHLTINASTESTVAFIGYLQYDELIDYSFIPGTFLSTGTYGIPYSIPAPYGISSVMGDPLVINEIQVGDTVTSADTKSYPVLGRGTSTYYNYVVVDLTNYQSAPIPERFSDVYVTRATNRTFTKLSSDANTGIILDADGAEIQIRGSVIPLQSASETHLGLPDSRWSDIWIGTGAVHLLDETYSRDVKISAKNGNFTVGRSGLEIGDLVIKDNRIESNTTNTSKSWVFGSNGALTAPGDIIPSANLTYDLGSTSSQWRSLYVGTSTIYLGGTPLTVSANGELIVNGNPISGGSTVQPYLELTNTPFIIQPVVEGEPVTVTAAEQGNSAQVEVVIGEGPVITSITVTNPGTGYVVGQRYRIWSYYIGGPDDTSSIEFEVETVGENGELLTIIDAAFVGIASNTPGTYPNANLDYRASVFDEIGTDLILTRGRQQALYNSALESEYNNNNYTSPLGTEWNADGWDNLVGFRRRSYATFRSALGNQVGNNIIGAELIMHDIANDRYYKFSFTEWGQNNGAYSYTRTEITDPNFFEKKDGGEEIDIIVEDDGQGSGIGITRGNNQGIYNPYRDEGWDSDFTPSGTEWNTDGWDDLSNIATRTYTNFYAAYNNGQLGNRVPGSKSILYIPDTGKYYAVQWINWSQEVGGGFSYLRYELDLTKLNEGITFADGTVQKTAYIPTIVKSTASGARRIEEVVGNNTVSVTGVITNSITATASRSVVDDNRFWVSNTATNIAAIINDPNSFEVIDSGTIQFSLDDITWYSYNNGYSGDSDEIGVSCSGGPFTYNEGDTIYFRYNSGGGPVVWWNKNKLPNGGIGFRGAVIDYHAFTGDATFIGTIHIVDDDNEENITHTEVSSGGTDSENNDLWLVQNEGTISYRRIDGESATLKIHWTARVFYGSEIYD